MQFWCVCVVFVTDFVKMMTGSVSLSQEQVRPNIDRI